MEFYICVCEPHYIVTQHTTYYHSMSSFYVLPILTSSHGSTLQHTPERASPTMWSTEYQSQHPTRLKTQYTNEISNIQLRELNPEPIPVRLTSRPPVLCHHIPLIEKTTTQ